MRRHATVLPALFLALSLASPATSQTGLPSILTSTAGEVSATAGGIIGYRSRFDGEQCNQNTGEHANYILMISFSGTDGFSLGTQIPLTIDFLVIHTFFADIGSPVLQSGFRTTLDCNGRAAAYVGFPPGFLEPLVGLQLTLAAVAFRTGNLPHRSTNAVKLDIVP